MHDDEARAEAGRDWWPLAIGWAADGAVPQRPAVVVRPHSTEEVSAVLAACNEAAVPVTAAAGRSGVCGGSIPVHGGVALDLTALDGLGDVDEASLTADVRAGTFGPDLEAALGEVGDGYTLGHWPQSMDLSTVGGWLACRGAGQYSTRYGKIEDMVVGLEVVLADGRVVRTEGKGPRAATGPNLTQLFVGSEGTLGVITEARLRIHPLPPAQERRAFGFTSFAAGLEACRKILRRGATPAVLRLYDETESDRNFEHGDTNVLIVLDEADPAILAATLQVVDAECSTEAGAHPLDVGLVERWLGHRNDVSALAPLWRGGIVVDTAEVSGPWSALPGLFDDVIGALKAIDGTLAASAHQSHAYPDGACLYFTFGGRGPDGDAAWRERYYRQAWDTVTDATMAHGAAISHHHGIGLNRSRFLPRALGAGFDVLGGLKATLRPQRHPQPRQVRSRVAFRAGALGMSERGRSILVVDVGTSGVRAAIVRPDATVEHEHRVPLLPDSPAPGLVEFDAARMADAVLEVARAALEDGGPVAGVGIANQRASSIVWERATGRPLAPGIGWQDLRTVGTCLVLQSEGIRLAPNASATKVMAILDEVDPERERAAKGELCFGTVDSWVAWTLSGGAAAGRDALHVTDATNAAVTALVDSAVRWDEPLLQTLRIPSAMLPAIVDSSGTVGAAGALPGAPPICGIAGDQQASLVGQGCTLPGLAKATFGTGGMLDQCVGPGSAPGAMSRGKAGTFPIVAFRVGGQPTWGTEAVMLSAGTAIEWLRDDLGIIATSKESATVAAQCATAGDVWFVPALLGLGTPVWDFGARGTLVGLTRGSGRPEIVRAVLEGVAHRGADLVEASESDSGFPIGTLRIDGGMTDNDVFVQALADAIGRPVEISPVLEATTLGAGLLAGLAVGNYATTTELAGTFSPRKTVEPRSSDADRDASRDRWLAARHKAEGTIPELSGISF